ncbi:ABC transporter substrate-binding protein [Methylomonas paludis]|uniref:ABC transporter substrate-binding protein n=1 Tax=Methylomonas paludis TaxID=1173101 RepID=A0A975MKX7_9GAMM|nr:ABC transporter substrate-binding protein [Methylomonas paludis]QWF69494.1 ABC transporter substrate-binding protein [Methylomonas paludis]
MKLPFLLVFFTLCYTNLTLAGDKPLIRIGLMASGTLGWEIAALQNEGLLADSEFRLETQTLANQQAGKVALQAGSVDIIVSDWIWVSGMRAEGADYTFYPFSSTAGGLIVPANSEIKTLADLKSKKLGIAGGELDKNWLLLQELGQQQGLDLNAGVQKVYAAPPLLNQQLAEQRIDALLTYWQFAARLETQGYRQLLSGEEIIKQLGIKETVPSLGYVFKQSWANQNLSAWQNFLTLADQARNKLCTSDQAWQKIANTFAAGDDINQPLLRERYCQGRVQEWGPANQAAAQQLYRLLHGLAGNKLTAGHPELQAGTFWLGR